MRLTGLVASFALLAACSSKSGQDQSSLQLTPSNNSAPADGTTAITIQIVAYGSDGTTPFNGQVELSCKNAVLFGNQSSAGVSDIVTITGGNGSDTVTCAPGTNCVGQNTIRGALIGLDATSSTEVTFTGPSGSTTGTVSGTTGGTTGTSGTGSGTSSTGGTSSGDGGAPPAPGAIVALPNLYPFMGVDYQTPYVLNVQNEFNFEVTNGATPAIAVPGATIVFTADPNNATGSYLVGGDGGTVIATTNDAGIASVFAHSGQAIGAVQVNALVEGTVYTTSSSTSVVGTQPSAGTSEVTCTPKNVPVFSQPNSPCNQNLQSPPIPASIVCTASITDRFGYAIGVPVNVTFYTEAGSIQGATVATDAGFAAVTIDPSGTAPEDVDPFPTEPALVDPKGYFCGTPHTFNPRDGLVTVLAVFSGEEPFKTNSASVWAPGVEFSDLPTPFIDANDDSIFDEGDTCINPVAGSCPGPNGLWDANTSVFVQTRVLFSGLPATFLNDAGMYSENTPINIGDGGSTVFFQTSPTSGVPLSVPRMGYQILSVTWGDNNLNVPTVQDSSQFIAGQESADTSIGVAFDTPTYPTTPSDTLGMNYGTQSYGQCDAGLMVTTDAGAAATTICHPTTAVTPALPNIAGFNTQVIVSNTNTTNPPQPIDIRATFNLNVATFGGDIIGIGN